MPQMSYLARDMLISNVWNSALPSKKKTAHLALDNFFFFTLWLPTGLGGWWRGASFVYLFAGLGIRMAIPIMYTSWDRKKISKKCSWWDSTARNSSKNSGKTWSGNRHTGGNKKSLHLHFQSKPCNIRPGNFRFQLVSNSGKCPANIKANLNKHAIVIRGSDNSIQTMSCHAITKGWSVYMPPKKQTLHLSHSTLLSNPRSKLHPRFAIKHPRDEFISAGRAKPWASALLFRDTIVFKREMLTTILYTDSF